MTAHIIQLQPRLDRRRLVAKRIDTGLRQMRLTVSDSTRRTAISRATCAAEHAPVGSVAREALEWIARHRWPTNQPPGAA